ncbi:hypothetical protein J6590_043551 [Homalodisca vitripennis]|nr:hypothetical protein J6590_043551 [Homalodisca vitripennis]
MGTLTGPGYLWALLSVAAAVLCCSGFYLPFWLQGKMLGRIDAYFNSFRRCNYPKLSPLGTVEVVMQCARYSRWRDIPSWWWQISTVLLSLACVLTIIVAVMAVSACCIDYVIHTATARTAGSLQLLADHYSPSVFRLCLHYHSGSDGGVCLLYRLGPTSFTQAQRERREITTALVTLDCVLTIITAVTAVYNRSINYVIYTATSRTAGSLQLLVEM